jgi:hypothetical protein
MSSKATQRRNADEQDDKQTTLDTYAQFVTERAATETATDEDTCPNCGDKWCPGPAAIEFVEGDDGPTLADECEGVNLLSFDCYMIAAKAADVNWTSTTTEEA